MAPSSQTRIASFLSRSCQHEASTVTGWRWRSGRCPRPRRPPPCPREASGTPRRTVERFDETRRPRGQAPCSGRLDARTGRSPWPATKVPTSGQAPPKYPPNRAGRVHHSLARGSRAPGNARDRLSFRVLWRRAPPKYPPDRAGATEDFGARRDTTPASRRHQNTPAIPRIYGQRSTG